MRVWQYGSIGSQVSKRCARWHLLRGGTNWQCEVAPTARWHMGAHLVRQVTQGPEFLFDIENVGVGVQPLNPVRVEPSAVSSNICSADSKSRRSDPGQTARRRR